MSSKVRCFGWIVSFEILVARGHHLCLSVCTLTGSFELESSDCPDEKNGIPRDRSWKSIFWWSVQLWKNVPICDDHYDQKYTTTRQRNKKINLMVDLGADKFINLSFSSETYGIMKWLMSFKFSSLKLVTYREVVPWSFRCSPWRPLKAFILTHEPEDARPVGMSS